MRWRKTAFGPLTIVDEQKRDLRSFKIWSSRVSKAPVQSERRKITHHAFITAKHEHGNHVVELKPDVRRHRLDPREWDRAERLEPLSRLGLSNLLRERRTDFLWSFRAGQRG